MTEADWNTCTDPQPLLEFLRGKVSGRKLRLFAVACCRRPWPSLQQEQCRNTVLMAELFAEGRVTQTAMTEARDAAAALFSQVQLARHHDSAEGSALSAAISAANVPAPQKSYAERLLDAIDPPWWEDEFDKGDPHAPAVVTAMRVAWVACYELGEKPLDDNHAAVEERCQQAVLLRHFLRNPFHQYPTPPSWPAPVVKLAEALYAGEDCSFALHDALLEAGHPELAEHFREKEHPKGCWVVDMILGKS